MSQEFNAQTNNHMWDLVMFIQNKTLLVVDGFLLLNIMPMEAWNGTKCGLS